MHDVVFDRKGNKTLSRQGSKLGSNKSCRLKNKDKKYDEPSLFQLCTEEIPLSNSATVHRIYDMWKDQRHVFQP